MKKKIALLLAAVMTFSAVPTLGLFAASTTQISTEYKYLDDNTLLVADLKGASTEAADNTIDVDYINKATNVSIRLGKNSTDELNVNDKFTLEYSDNAEWYFAKGPKVAAASGNKFEATFPEAGAAGTVVTAEKDALNAFIAKYEAAVAIAVTDDDTLTAAKTAFDAAVAVAPTTVSAYTTAAKAVATAVAGYADFAAYSDATNGYTTLVQPTATEKTDAINVAVATDTAASTPGTNPSLYFVGDDNSKDGEVFKKLTAYNGAGEALYDIAIDKDGQQALITIIKPIAPDNEFAIPAILKSNDDGGEITLEVEGASLTTKKISINTNAAVGATTTTVKDVESGRDDVEIDTIQIKESVSGVIKNGATKFTIGDDYEWVLNNPKMTLDAAFGSSASATAKFYLNDDKTELTVVTSGITPTFGGVKGKLSIDGLKVQPNDDTVDSGYFGQTVTMDVEEVELKDEELYLNGTGSVVKVNAKKSGVKEQTGIKIASFIDYSTKVSFDSSTAKVVEELSGKMEIEAGKKGDDIAKIKFEELTTNSWWTTRALDITLTDADGKVLEGVKFNKFEITDTDNVNLNKGKFTEVEKSGDVKFARDKVSVTARGTINATKLSNFKFTVEFNAAANFEGDVYVNIGGLGVKDEDMRLKVATIAAPIKVTAKTTNVAIGYLSYAVGDITVTENKAGALSKYNATDKNEVTFTVRPFGNIAGASTYTGISFNPVKSDTLKVTDGDIQIDKLTLTGNKISAQVKKESKTASTFTLSGLGLVIDRSVPFGAYDLIVGGKAVAASYDEKAEKDDAKFDIEGIVLQKYVDVSTPGSATTISKNVVVVVGTTMAKVDGKDVDMAISTYIDPASGRTMLPLRAVSMLFGINDNNVIWDAVSGKATIIIGEKIVTFSSNSSVMTINGVEVNMVDENGVAVKAAINPETNRMYIPLRQLGLAYGVDVLWVNSNPGLAIFNPTAAQKEEATNASNAPAEEEVATDEATTEEATDTEAAAE